jgi:hypothetical protein
MTIPGDKVMWPSLPISYGGNPNNRNRKKGIVVRVSKDGQPLANHPVNLSLKIILHSGGHNHDKKDNKYPKNEGTIVEVADSSKNQLTALTNARGELKLQLVAGSFGGLYTFNASTIIRGKTYRKIDTLLVRVPGLDTIPDSPYYVKTGGTCNHHGPRTDGLYPGCRTPDENHYLEPIPMDSLEKAAKDFYEADWNAKQEKMRINDASLPDGGEFDISGNWKTPHLSHRIGKDVDIENLKEKRNLLPIMSNYGWTYIKEGSTYYPHFRFTGK